ncbi:hypothetical protein HYDPIDRAFT_39001 [Hydnomerulius pinastri MD-312]|nr:hypothetical protein HYDPIDRAFT_39001 [Hydnomerulius pinastri MD-312]
MASPLPDRITPVTQSLYEQTYGGSLICNQVMLVLYGISTLQTYIYFLHYVNDSIYMKSLVLVVWIFGSLHAFLVCHTVYHYLVLSYTDPMYLVQGEWSVYTATCVGVIVCFCVQIFFARMIFYLTKGRRRIILTTILGFFIVAQIAFGIFLSADLFIIWDLYKISEAVYPAMVPLFFTRVASDTVTAITLCVVLYDSQTSFKRSVRLVKTLIIYSMNRFVLTTVVVIIQTIILIVKPGSIWAMVIEFVSVQLYANSLLATLNSRNYFRAIGSGDSNYMTAPSTTAVGYRRGGASTELTTFEASANSTVNVDLKNHGIRVDKERVVVADFEGSQEDTAV